MLFPIAQRILRIPFNLLLRYGPPSMKRSIWDREFASGKWNFIDETAGDCVYAYLEKYAANGSILDLGCGPGNTANELSATAYRDYVGVDISEVALEKARSRSRENGRAQRNRFYNSDFLDFVPDRQFDIILMRESIYHVPASQVGTLLVRYSTYLKPGGVFIVRVVTGNSASTKARVKIIENSFTIVESARHSAEGLTILVFKPRVLATTDAASAACGDSMSPL